MTRFRILSLDGGGIKGTFTASVVASLEEQSQKALVDHFDLITGTSTGGIIALALGIGVSGSDILDFYTTKGPDIFPSTGFHQRMWHTMRHAFRPKHSSAVLRKHLTDVLTDRKLGHSKARMVIPTFDSNAGRIKLFKTAHHPRLVQDYQRRLVDIAMATSAAPTYFAPFTSHAGQSFLDGGVWANCPILVALLEAIHVLKQEPSSIEVLSIGTTEAPFDIAGARRLGGIMSWSRRIVQLLMEAQVDAAMAQAQIVTGKRVLRIDAMTRPGRFRLDDVRQIEQLRGLGTYHAQLLYEEVATRFLDTPAPKFSPEHTVGPLAAAQGA
jgi:patatin-like phospholipase/acyl hydrolase